MVIAATLRNHGLANCSTNLHLVITIGIFLYALIMGTMWNLVAYPDIEPPGLAGYKKIRDEENEKQGRAFGSDILILFASPITIASTVTSILMYRVYTDNPYLQHLQVIPTTSAISNAVGLLPQPGALQKVQAERPVPADASATVPAETV
jgi:hypothetical protein